MPGIFANIRFEDIEPGGPYRNYGAADETVNLKKLRIVADYLASKNIPFDINVIPSYVNPTHPEQNASITDTNSPYIQEFINTLKYMESKGGVIGLHGFTHQYRSTVSGSGDEFHTNSLSPTDPNNPPDDITYDNSRVKSAFDAMSQAGFEAKFWTEPHYSAIGPFYKQENVFPRYISILKQYDVNHSSVTSINQRQILYNDIDYQVARGSVYNNASLEYVSPGVTPDHTKVLSVPYILYNAQQFTDGDIAAFFYHPFLEFNYMIQDGSGNWIYHPAMRSYLHQIIETGASDSQGFYPSLTAQGYTFKTVRQLIPFAPAQRLQTPLSSGLRVLSGDFNGDGKEDVVIWNMSTGDWTVYLSNITQEFPRTETTNQFLLSGVWLSHWAISGLWIPMVGDVNGDGKDDLIVYNFTLGQWQVALSDGTKFVPQPVWLDKWAVKDSQNKWQVMVGDFNGDGKIDILAANANSVQVAFSDGTSFIAQGTWLNNRKSGLVYTGDFDGNGRNEIAIWDSAQGNWYTALNTGSSFEPQETPWITGFGVSEGVYSPFVSDFNGDGKSDILLYAPSTGTWEVALSSGSSFSRYFLLSSGPWGKSSYYWITVGDFDGNGKEDIGLQDINKGTFDIAISMVQ